MPITLDDLVASFNTQPFLFVGSGLSIRYLNLPNWENLLREFAYRAKNKPYAYEAYISMVQNMPNPQSALARIGSLIEKDFNRKWFSSESIRTIDVEHDDMIRKGVSPFKLELASYLKSVEMVADEKKEEVEALRSLVSKSIAGIITTNYDTFLS